LLAKDAKSRKAAKGHQLAEGQAAAASSAADHRNTLNDLTNAQWMYFSRNVWTTTYSSELGFDLRKKQGGNKPPRLMKELIEMFTKKGQKVLDPMCGVGGTLLGCSLAGRDGIGIELNPEWIRIYDQVCKREGIKKFKVIQGDCLSVLKTLPDNSIDLAIVDPPYREDTKWDRTMCNDTHAARVASVPERYSTDGADFGNIMDYPQFLAKIRLLSAELFRVLKQEKYLVVFAKDEYQGREFREKSAEMAEAVHAAAAGFQWKSKITWYQHGAKLRPYGVPYSFVPNITDQKILVFKKSDRVGRTKKS
jgi:DNA modification methylase